MSMKLDGKTSREIAEEIFSFQCYWWKWELKGVEIDRPDIYKEVLEEFNQITEKESRSTQVRQSKALKSD